MRKIIRNVFVGIAILCLCGAFIIHRASADEIITRKIIIFEPSVTDSQTKINFCKKYNINSLKEINLVNGISVEITKSEENLIKKENNILRIEDDIEVQALGKTTGTPTIPTQPPQTVPWNITKVNAEGLANCNYGQGVKVAVIDTGIDINHPDLKSNIIGGYNAINKKASFTDDNGHGTHVAGILAAPNNSIGVIGVSYNVSLYSVKVLNGTGNGYLSDLIEGIDWCIKNGIQVANMSLGVADSTSLHDAIIKAYQAGLILVAAAGNNLQDGVKYPAAYPEVISVGASDNNDLIGSFCPNGKIDITAPGVNIYSTYINGAYLNMTGTSMATPHVTAAAAILVATPAKGDLNGDGKITPSEIKQRLQNTSKDLGSLGIDKIYGSGLLDVYTAITQ